MDPISNPDRGDFSPADAFSRAIRYWWLVIVLMIVGGLFGLLISAIEKPIYESTSVITTVINFAYSGKLTPAEEDHLLTAIGDVIQSDEVLDKVVKMGIDQGLAPDAGVIRAALTASRQGFRWELSSRSQDPQSALAINQLWLDTAESALTQFRLDSLSAIVEFNAQVGVENCFQQAVIIEPVSAFCSVSDFQALRNQIESLSAGSLKQSLLTRLLASRISFEVTQEPDLPTQPVHLGRNTTVLAGAVLGLIGVIILLITGFPSMKKSDKVK